MKILVIDLEGTDLDAFLSDDRMENILQLIEMGGYGTLVGPKPEGFRVAVTVDGSDFYAWDYLAEIEKKAILIGQPFSVQPGNPNISWVPSFFEAIGNVSIENYITANQAQFATAKDFLQSQTWDYFQLTDSGATHLSKLPGDQISNVRTYLTSLDHEIGMLLQLLTDEVILLVLFQNAREGNIVMNSNEVINGNDQFILASANNPLLGDLSNVGWDEIFPTLFELAGFAIGRPFTGTSLVASRSAEILRRNDLAPDEAKIIRERLSGLGYIG